MIGKKVFHYDIIESIGKGGAGEVYLAKDTKLERKVALKFLSPSLILDATMKKRFTREARVTASLNHPNIVVIYEINEYKDRIYIAMEYIKGQTLREILVNTNTEYDLKQQKKTRPYQVKEKNGQSLPLDVEGIIAILVQICEGLKKAHQAGIVHRDIKPENIMINEEGTVKILDFGLAKLKGVNQLTHEYSTPGTIHYMSPEQINGQEIDQRSDLWSLGVLLYEMVSRQRPFVGDFPQAVMFSILNKEPQHLHFLVRGFPKGFKKILDKALSKDVDSRYQSAAELLSDLKKLNLPESKTTIEKTMPIAVSDQCRIAVMDFNNLGDDETVDWLCGGIAETVTMDLKKISSLNVVGRQMVYKVLGKGSTSVPSSDQIIETGMKLKARWLITGGFQKHGQKIRINAYIFKVIDGKLLGTTKVDGAMDQIFQLQDQIIIELIKFIKLEVRDSDIKKINIPETAELKAYEYNAKARSFIYEMNTNALNEAQKHLSKALDIDPQYAQAYSGLGSTYMIKYIATTKKEYLQKGIEALQKAIAIDANLADSYLWLTYGYMRKNEFNQAAEAGRNAARLEPDNGLAYYFLGTTLMVQACIEYQPKLFVEAVKILQKNLKFSPNYQVGNMSVAWIYLLHGQYQEAEKYLDHAVKIEQSGKGEGPKFIGAATLLGNLFLRQNKFNKAEECYNASLKVLNSSHHVYTAAFIGLTYLGYGKIHCYKTQYNQALEFYKKAELAIDKSPQSLGIGYYKLYCHINLAITFFKLGMRQEAQDMFAAALDFFQNKQDFDFSWIWEGCDAQVHYHFASYYALRNHVKEACKSLDQAMTLGWADWPCLEKDENFHLLRHNKTFNHYLKKLKQRQPLPS